MSRRSGGVKVYKKIINYVVKISQEENKTKQNNNWALLNQSYFPHQNLPLNGEHI